MIESGFLNPTCTTTWTGKRLTGNPYNSSSFLSVHLMGNVALLAIIWVITQFPGALSDSRYETQVIPKNKTQMKHSIIFFVWLAWLTEIA